LKGSRSLAFPGLTDCGCRASHLPGSELREEVERTIRLLGLFECADTFVGGSSGGIQVSGISGGERKRLAIACETVGSHGDLSGVVVIADEPTSGSHSAFLMLYFSITTR
jgi:ABC-type multidrug transport system ATPase subunit